jgi:hypothetical protein
MNENDDHATAARDTAICARILNDTIASPRPEMVVNTRKPSMRRLPALRPELREIRVA